jgi:hypothetical protein
VYLTPQRVHALVARLIGHLEDRGAARSSAGQEARAQRVPGELLRIEPGASGVRFLASALRGSCNGKAGGRGYLQHLQLVPLRVQRGDKVVEGVDAAAHAQVAAVG